MVQQEQQEEGASGGHVFVTQGDLAALVCDAWLLPTDEWLHVTRHLWIGASRPLRERLDRLPDIPPLTNWGSGDGEVRVMPFDDWPLQERLPVPYLVNVGAHSGTPVEWYLEGVRQFFATVAARHPGPSHVVPRARRLIALPLVGTGYGGAGDIKGDIIRGLLKELYKATRRYGFDVVLVTRTRHALAAVQNGRLQLLNGPETGAPVHPWSDLDGALRETARTLARRVAEGQLVLFIGAGVGRGAGLPDWAGLLDALAYDAGLSQSERAALRAIPVLDRARLIQDRLAASAGSMPEGEARGRLSRLVSERLATERYSLAHSLLAALPVSETVTTNYDALFETASEDAGVSTAVLPYQAATGCDRWLLKMHGCVTRPDDIVLTRSDYLRYDDRRAALMGIVQALLITRHMLFVGFSLTDDNFYRVVDEVHKAVRGTDGRSASGEAFGTALLLHPDRWLGELWRADLHLVYMADERDTTIPEVPSHAEQTTDEEPANETARQVEDTEARIWEAARRLDIFLDYLLAEAVRDQIPLLDDSYEGILTEEERRVRQALRDLEARVAEVPEETFSTLPAWQPVRALLERMRGSTRPRTGCSPTRDT